MRFIIRSNSISLLLDVLFNIGLGFFCTYHFRIPPQQHSYALGLLLSLYVPRTIAFFWYRTYIMLPIARFLKAGDKAEKQTVLTAARAAYEVSLKSNIFYTVTFIALYGVYTYMLWLSDSVSLSTNALVAGAFLSIAVGMGAFALGFPLNMVVNSRITNRLSLLLRQRGWQVDALTMPLKYRMLIMGFCLTGTPCLMMLSVQAMAMGTQSKNAWWHLSLLCVLLACWALLSAILVNLTISRPVDQVKSMVDQILRGISPDKLQHVPVSYLDELGVLAEGTNRMLDQLRESRDRIEGQVQELEATNASLTEATKVKGEFLASMSHELRTPLNSIIGFSKILLRKTKQSVTERQFRNLQQINKSGHQLLSLVNDILDFEKIEAGRLTISPKEVLCEEFRERLAETHSGTAEEAGLKLRIEVVDSPLTLWTDPDRLAQILGNFIVNAVKYAGVGTVLVRFERTENEIRCSVTDEGPGIPAEKQVDIFDSFQQLADGKAGVGLGLAIVSKLAALMGGRVDLESELGSGSTFSFYLPRSHELGELGLGRLKPIGTGPEILVVDDQPEFLELMHGELTEAGYCVHLARSGEMALQKLQSLKPAAVVLDIVMPGLGGWETLKQIRNNEATAKLPVVVSSVLDDSPMGYDLGIKGWLTKPFQAADLGLVLRNMEAGGRVLIVDDDEATVDMLGQVLTGMKVEHCQASNGREALHQIENAKDVGAVILDLGLPDMDGFEVLEKMRSLPGGEKLNVVAYTGRDLSGTEKARLQNSLARVVEKHGSNSLARVVRTVTG
jgi:signal transduction histidine kinase/CheY-like chemotaxis protein